MSRFQFLYSGLTEQVCQFVIIDSAGEWPIDKSYKDIGLREGWLELTGHYMQGDICVMTYKMV